MAVRAFVGLGSNLGDRLANLRRAVGLLGGDGIEVLRTSRVYETAPVGPPQPDYLNAVVEVATDLDPHDLLRSCLEVEKRMGRLRAARWGPRVIDLDVLTYGSEIIDDADLVVPHPRMHERAFVLVPLLELDAAPPLPAGRRVGDLRLGTVTDVRPFAPPFRVADREAADPASMA